MRFFDLHCDTMGECSLKDIPLRNNQTLQISLERAGNFSAWFQCFAAWIPDDAASPLAYFRRIARRLEWELKQNEDRMLQCRTAEGLHRAVREKKCGAIFTVEGGSVLEGRCEVLEELAGLGVKVMTLTWNAANQIGGGAQEPGGLTPFGKEVLAKMESLGILPDVSHASEPLFWDVLENTRGPVIATHSDAKALCSHPRNLTDQQFLALKQRGGLVGLNFYPTFLADSGKAEAVDILRHAEHFLSLGGEEVLAMGSDFDGADMPSGITGIESMEYLAELFARHGYSDDLIDRIFYQNSFRFFEKYMCDMVKSADSFDKLGKL